MCCANMSETSAQASRGKAWPSLSMMTSFAPGTAAAVSLPCARGHQRIGRAVDDQGRNRQPAQGLGPVRSGHDSQQLPDYAVRVEAPVVQPGPPVPGASSKSKAYLPPFRIREPLA